MPQKSSPPVPSHTDKPWGRRERLPLGTFLPWKSGTFSKSRGSPGKGPPGGKEGPDQDGAEGPHHPFRVGDFLVEGFLRVSDPHHGRLELPGHLQGEGRASAGSVSRPRVHGGAPRHSRTRELSVFALRVAGPGGRCCVRVAEPSFTATCHSHPLGRAQGAPARSALGPWALTPTPFGFKSANE